MRIYLGIIFATLAAALVTFAVGVPLTNGQIILKDIHALGDVVAVLHQHVDRLGTPGFNPLVMIGDDKNVIDCFDRMGQDAIAAKSFSSAEIVSIIPAIKEVAIQVANVCNLFIAKKVNVPVPYRGLVVQFLRGIITHAKSAGDDLVEGCPPDKKSEAEKVYAQIGYALERAANDFASSS